MKKIYSDRNSLVILSTKLLSMIELCNGNDLAEIIFFELCSRFSFSQNYDSQRDRIGYLVLIGIDLDEVVLETIKSSEVSEYLKNLETYVFSIDQFHTEKKITESVFYLTKIAHLEHELFEDFGLLNDVFEGSILHVDVNYLDSDSNFITPEIIFTKKIQSVREFVFGKSNLSFYLSPADISDGRCHHIEISDEYEILYTKLGGALGLSVNRVGFRAEINIKKFFEEKFQWRERFYKDIVVESMDMLHTLGLNEQFSEIKTMFSSMMLKIGKLSSDRCFKYVPSNTETELEYISSKKYTKAENLVVLMNEPEQDNDSLDISNEKCLYQPRYLEAAAIGENEYWYSSPIYIPDFACIEIVKFRNGFNIKLSPLNSNIDHFKNKFSVLTYKNFTLRILLDGICIFSSKCYFHESKALVIGEGVVLDSSVNLLSGKISLLAQGIIDDN